RVKPGGLTGNDVARPDQLVAIDVLEPYIHVPGRCRRDADRHIAAHIAVLHGANGVRHTSRRCHAIATRVVCEAHAVSVVDRRVVSVDPDSAPATGAPRESSTVPVTVYGGCPGASGTGCASPASGGAGEDVGPTGTSLPQ